MKKKSQKDLEDYATRRILNSPLRINEVQHPPNPKVEEDIFLLPGSDCKTCGKFHCTCGYENLDTREIALWRS